MLQSTGELHIAYRHDAPDASMYAVLLRGKDILFTAEECGGSRLPRYGTLPKPYPLLDQFDIEGTRYGVISLPEAEGAADLLPLTLSACRSEVPLRDLYAVYTARHLASWYEANRFCGRCGAKTVSDENERMLRCPACGQMIFPKICPAVVVALRHKDRLLLTRYANRPFKNYGLVAGFVEIGETAEQTVARECAEEVGLRVKNVRYLGSQPWGVVGNLMLGYYAEVGGPDAVTLADGELAEATWFTRETVPVRDDVSLTGDIIRRFAHGDI